MQTWLGATIAEIQKINIDPTPRQRYLPYKIFQYLEACSRIRRDPL